jgi:glycosyltransferase involved in cell wall biosynthesis
MKKVVHITSVHSPFDTRIFHKECRTLKNANYDVVLIAPHKADEIRDGITIKAVEGSNGRFSRMTSLSRQIYRKALDENGDIYHFHDPELIPVGLLLKLRGKRVVYDVHEHYPRMIKTKEWVPTFFRRTVAFIVNILEIVSSFFFDKIIVVVPYIGNRFQKKKVVLVRNYLLDENLKIEPQTDYKDRPMTIVYHGSICRERGIEEMVSSIEAVNKKLSVRLMLIGRFDTEALEASMNGMAGWKYVDFKGWLDITSILEIAVNARIGLALLHPVPTHIDSLPTKLFEYMAVGIPVVISNIEMWKDIVEKYHCGIVVDPLNINEITDAIIWLLENPDKAEEMGENGRTAVEKYFTWNNEAIKLLSAYASMFKNNST